MHKSFVVIKEGANESCPFDVLFSPLYYLFFSLPLLRCSLRREGLEKGEIEERVLCEA